MKVVFDSDEDGTCRTFVVDVKVVNETDLIGIHAGQERTFSLDDIEGAVTISGRPFSLRPYREETAALS